MNVSYPYLTDHTGVWDADCPGSHTPAGCGFFPLGGRTPSECYLSDGKYSLHCFAKHKLLLGKQVLRIEKRPSMHNGTAQVDDESMVKG